MSFQQKSAFRIICEIEICTFILKNIHYSIKNSLFVSDFNCPVKLSYDVWRIMGFPGR